MTQFLNGAEDVIITRLKNKLGACLKTLDYEKASVYQGQIDFCHKFCARQRFIRSFSSARSKIVIPGDPEQTYRFASDRITLEEGKGANRRTCQTLHFTHVPNWASDKRFQLDRANIVYNWIHRRRDLVVEFGDMESEPAIRSDRDMGQRRL